MIFENDTAVFTDEPFWRTYLGYASFTTGDSLFASEFGSVTTEVSTSLGSLQGSLDLPDTLDTVVFSCGDTLELEQSLTVSWSGSEADLYAFYSYYNWLDTVGMWQYEYLDTFITADSVVFEGSRFAHDGIVYVWKIDAINGPPPYPGVSGNMSGSGAGYLYYVNGSGGDLNRYIVVGAGTPVSLSRIVPEPCGMFRESDLWTGMAERLGIAVK